MAKEVTLEELVRKLDREKAYMKKLCETCLTLSVISGQGKDQYVDKPPQVVIGAVLPDRSEETLDRYNALTKMYDELDYMIGSATFEEQMSIRQVLLEKIEELRIKIEGSEFVETIGTPGEKVRVKPSVSSRIAGAFADGIIKPLMKCMDKCHENIVKLEAEIEKLQPQGEKV